MNENSLASLTKHYKVSTTAENADKIQLTEEEYRFNLLSNAIQKGLDSGTADNFDPVQHLAILKGQRKKMVDNSVGWHNESIE